MPTAPAPFDELFRSALRGVPPRRLEPGECQSEAGHRCTLCAASSIDYAQEAALKDRLLQEFWRTSGSPIALDTLIHSPRGRGYRTVTKRKVFHGRDSVQIGLIDPSERGLRPFEALRCAIEPPEHAVIYATVRREIGRPPMGPLAEQLNYVIVKGTERELTVILNVREVGTRLIRAANDLSKLLSRACRSIVATFVYQEESGGRYYLGSRPSRPPHALRKLFGKSDIALSVAGVKLLYGPLSFSQVNHSILKQMIDTVAALLKPSTGRTLYDLYCGYGMFALCLARHFRSVVGAERYADSIEAARENAARLKIRNVRFVRQDITAESLPKTVQNLHPDDAVLLDPPRGGTGEGVIECVAAHRPALALHIFCNIDLIPSDRKRWEDNGYRLARAVPLDMFPGTPDVEMILLFERR